MMASAVAATGISSAATGAFAQAAPTDETVNFTGTVGSVCVFSNNTPGTLMVDTVGDQIAAGFPGATMGSVDLDCTGGVDISVGMPQDNGSSTDLLLTAVDVRSFASVVGTPGAVASNDNGTSLSTGAIPGPFSDTVEVDMYIDAGAPIPAGAYDYNVVVTATPQ